MKNPIKTISLSLAIAAFSISSFAQTATGLHAYIKNTDAEIKASIQANTFEIGFVGADNDQQLSDLKAKAKPYEKFFTISISDIDNGTRIMKVSFIGTPQVKVLQRFFMATSFVDIQQDRTQKTVADFFKPFL